MQLSQSSHIPSGDATRIVPPADIGRYEYAMSDPARRPVWIGRWARVVGIVQRQDGDFDVELEDTEVER